MFEELTIADYHRRLQEGSITTTELVSWYLDRIEQNMEGRGLNAVVSVNEKAQAEAERCDARLVAGGSLNGPLHGVPVLVKDQGETAGIRTTFGNRLFQNYTPDTDATVVTRLREAGAIILGKTTMCDFAAGWFSSSSLTGHTSSAYDPVRDSGGSSAGSGAGVAANLCMVAIGEDTGGSIRIPASFNNVCGLRVTTGVVSRHGFSPLVHFQDTPGPMARTVRDVATVLDAIGGYDPHDEYTSVATQLRELGDITRQIPDATGGLDGWSVGVVETAFDTRGTDAAQPVNDVILRTLSTLTDAGLTIRRGLEIDGLHGWIADTSVYSKVSRSDISAFLRTRDADIPVRDLDALYASGAFHPENDLYHDLINGPDDPETDLGFLRAKIAQEEFRRLILALFAGSKVDALVYPTVQVVPPTFQDLEDGLYTCLTFPTNTVIASQAGLPALSLPAGFTDDGLPVGLEIVGRPFSEGRLLHLASEIETVLAARRPPNLASPYQEATA